MPPPRRRIDPDFAPVSDFIVSDACVPADEPAPVEPLPDDVAPVDGAAPDDVAPDEPLVSEPLAELPDVPCAIAGPAKSRAAAAAAVVVFHMVMS
jgi:hypothetical protein